MQSRIANEDMTMKAIKYLVPALILFTGFGAQAQDMTIYYNQYGQSEGYSVDNDNMTNYYNQYGQSEGYSTDQQ
jgi:hypothetical protein